MPVASAIIWLLEPGKPVWVKGIVIAGWVAAAVGWWKRDYWQNLHTPDGAETKHLRARPPF